MTLASGHLVRSKKLRRGSWMIALLFSAVMLGIAGPAKVLVSFEFPDRDPYRIEMTYEEAAQELGRNSDYMVEFYVHAAFRKTRP